jgi:hypothetical protein
MPSLSASVVLNRCALMSSLIKFQAAPAGTLGGDHRRAAAKNAIGTRCGASRAVEVASAIIVTGFSVGCKKAGLPIRS